MKKHTSFILFLILSVALGILSTQIFCQTLDYSFVVVGCNRVNDVDTVNNPSTANVPALNRLFSEVSNINPVPSYLFIAGDLILGYVKDTVEVSRQLREWVKLYQASPLASKSTKLVVIPGNHETQDKKAGKLSFLDNESAWLKIMAPYILGNNGPTADSTHGDSMKTDQSKLTYSFNFKGDHFVMLNTDPVGRDWRVPTLWVGSDLATARLSGARHIFLIGHKPAYPGINTATLNDGLAKYPVNRDAFWSVLESNQSEAMFAAHVHVWDKIQPHANKTWQIIAGNGGSQVESTWVANLSPKPAYHGYTLINIYTNGKVDVLSKGHDIDNGNTKYFLDAATAPTTLRDSVEISGAGAVGIKKNSASSGDKPSIRLGKSIDLKNGEMTILLPSGYYHVNGRGLIKD